MRYFQAFFLFVLICAGRPEAARAQSSQEMLKQMRSTVTETIDGREYYIHTVKRGQTLYMISRAYGIDINDLIRENPQVSRGLKADEKIRIPLKPGKPVSTNPKTTAAQAKQANTEPPAAKLDTVVPVELPCGKDNSTKKQVYRVALMLPLFLGDVEALNAENPDPQVFETARSLQFLPFYEGFRMALDSMTRMGLKVRLFVYDADKDTTRTKQILRKPEMKSMDLIFGVLYQRNFQLVAEFAKKNHINLVNPISEKSEIIAGNPWVFKVQPPKKTLADELAEYMSQKFTGGRVLIVRNGQFPDRDAPEQLRKECTERGLSVRIVEGQEAAIGALSENRMNYLAVFTDKSAYAFDLTRRFFELRGKDSVTLVGLPDWNALEGLETEYLVALKTHVISANFIDYEDRGVKKFVAEYQSVYHDDPGLLAFQGFDTGFFFLTALGQYGTNIQRCIGELQVKSMQTHFDFHQSKGNGFENQHWMISKYDNYRLVRVH